ncbi:hypothetical protein K469DRAFT_686499 [Zopfia rhizophila CBS 207.26]|uniref:Cytochrome P450 n=1 Tax=Zopfia rhizophila CBS 207.26 TaxID=1314779 RepID=A0A6A6EWI5_9PEZI|nr:hypothetical protein K469DRAFT_686499 [Zopfia rhizophila CBS 207.26]
MNTFARHAASLIPVNASKLFVDLGYDAISDLVWGKSLGMLLGGPPPPAIKVLLEGKSMSRPKKLMGEYIKWYDIQLAKRRETKLDSPDFHTLLSTADEFDTSGAYDAQPAVVAGADTVSTTLSNICYLIGKISHPSKECCRWKLTRCSAQNKSTRLTISL